MHKQLKFFLLVLLVFLKALAYSQSFVVSGTITDKSSGEQLVGVNVYELNSKRGTACNNYGFYSLTLPSDSVVLVFSYVGYQTQNIRLKLDRNISLNVQLEQSTQLKEVEISAEKQNPIQEHVQMSTVDIPIQQIKKTPALLGEVDVLKVLQLLPGVKSGNEGSSGVYIRGGGPDQNLILLDGVPVYNASHLFGFFSVFNADAVKNVSLIKGGFPARYGGRLSGVIDISMKEGNKTRLSGEGSIGIISSKLALEGPIIKNRTSFLVTARRTYVDLLTRPFIKIVSKSQAIIGYYFYDLNAKFNHKLNDHHHLFLSLYNGNDKFYFRYKNQVNYSGYDEFGNYTDFNYKEVIKGGLGWGNSIAALRWNYLVSSKCFINTTINYTVYRFNINAYNSNELYYNNKSSKSAYGLNYNSGINDWTVKTDAEFFPNNLHTFRFGLKTTYHTFKTGALQFITQLLNEKTDSTIGAKPLYAYESSAYAEHEWTLTQALKMNNGLHFSHFFVQGKNYYSLQPRLSARYLLKNSWSIKASYVQMAQFIHLLTNSNVGLPTDLWVPATALVKPQYSQQVAGGMAKSLKNNTYEFTVEAYYKTMKNIIEYFDGANFVNTSSDWQRKVEAGIGKSYGAEFLLQRKEGKFTGWIGYTLSWTNRTFPTINFGRTFPYKYDRRHDISFVLSYKINEKIDFSGTWVYASGNAITLAIANYQGFVYNNNYPTLTNTLQYYGGRNNFRMPAYHRADIGFNFHTSNKWGSGTWNISVYNLYNRWNPFFIFYTNEGGKEVAKQVTLFPLIPSVSYGFKF